MCLGYQKILNQAQAEEEVDKIMSAVDKNHSGAIDYSGCDSDINKNRIRDGNDKPRIAGRERET
jgi:hypothetical protein